MSLIILGKKEALVQKKIPIKDFLYEIRPVDVHRQHIPTKSPIDRG